MSECMPKLFLFVFNCFVLVWFDLDFFLGGGGVGGVGGWGQVAFVLLVCLFIFMCVCFLIPLISIINSLKMFSLNCFQYHIKFHPIQYKYVPNN